jgi:hypothetical protein
VNRMNTYDAKTGSITSSPQSETIFYLEDIKAIIVLNPRLHSVGS